MSNSQKETKNEDRINLSPSVIGHRRASDLRNQDILVQPNCEWKRIGRLDAPGDNLHHHCIYVHPDSKEVMIAHAQAVSIVVSGFSEGDVQGWQTMLFLSVPEHSFGFSKPYDDGSGKQVFDVIWDGERNS